MVKSIGSKKVVKVARGVGQQLEYGDMVVTSHPPLHFHRGHVLVDATKRNNESMVFREWDEAHDAAIESHSTRYDQVKMLWWCPCLSTAPLSSEQTITISHLLSNLLTCGAVPSTPPGAAYRPALEETRDVEVLLMHRLVDLDEHTGRCRLTSLALRSLEARYDLSEPQSLFECKADTPNRDLTVFQAIRRLESLGWQWQAWGSKRKRQRWNVPLGYVSGAPKIWYSASRVVNVHYLHCLLEGDELFKKGLGMIPHVARKAGLYTRLLAGDNELSP